MVIVDVKLVTLILVSTVVMLSGKATGMLSPGPMYSHVARGEPKTEQMKVMFSPIEVGDSRTTAAISRSMATSGGAAANNITLNNCINVL